MDKENAKKSSLWRVETLDFSESDPNLLDSSGQGEGWDKTQSKRCTRTIDQKKPDTAKEVFTYEGAVELIGGICRRLDEQDARMLKYACNHNDRLTKRKEESDDFIAEFKKEQQSIREETQKLLALLKPAE